MNLVLVAIRLGGGLTFKKSGKWLSLVLVAIRLGGGLTVTGTLPVANGF